MGCLCSVVFLFLVPGTSSHYIYVPDRSFFSLVVTLLRFLGVLPWALVPVALYFLIFSFPQVLRAARRNLRSRASADPNPPVIGPAKEATAAALQVDAAAAFQVDAAAALEVDAAAVPQTDGSLLQPDDSGRLDEAHIEEVRGWRDRVSCLEAENKQLTSDSICLEAENQRLTRDIILARPSFWLVARYRFVDNRQTPDQRETCIEVPTMDRGVLHLKNPKRPLSMLSYRLDRVFGPESSNRDVYECIQPVIQAAFHDHPAGLIMDGYSGTGKSHTMLDGEDAIFTSVARDLMSWRQRTVAEGGKPSIRCSIVEVYREKTYDLLRDGREVEVKANGDHILPQECFYTADTAGKLLHSFEAANKVRKSAKTPNNRNSSRSHLIATISLSRCPAEGSSTLFLADLAGAERMIADGTPGFSDQQKESIAAESCKINLSRTELHRLAKDVTAGKDRRSNASRGPVLTKILQSLFHPNSRVAIVMHVSSALTHIAETQGTLQHMAELQPQTAPNGRRAATQQSARASVRRHR